MKNYTAIIALALALPAGFASAQQPEGRPPGPPPGEGRPQSRSERGEKPHLPPIIAALDKNGDGVISEDEIAGAAESLRKLASEHGGKLTIEDLLGPPPRGMRGIGERPPGAPREGQRNGPRDGQPREGQPRGEFRPQPDRPREGQPRGDAPPRPDAPRDGATRGHSDARRGERIASNRDGVIPLPMPPRDGFNPDRPGPGGSEIRARALAPREGDARRELNRAPREHFEPRPELRRDGFMPPPMPPRDGARRPEMERPHDGAPRGDTARDGGPRPERGAPPRDERRREAARPEISPRDGGPRPERPDAPRGDRPAGDAPRPEGEPPCPNPEG
jgi:hypothetical protein